MRAVLDTNVFISGIFWKGQASKVISHWKEGKFTLVVSLEIVSEIITVLKDFKIQLPGDMIKKWSDLIVRNSLVVEPSEKLNVVRDDPKDNMFIEAAVAGNADYIVSQDNHLLKLKEHRRIKIVSPEDFIGLFE